MSRESYSKWLYPAFLFVVVFLFFARWPIFAGDYDLWYHLAGGRYFFQHHRLPDFSFFSFLEPPRRWVDYYWLFQVFVYRLYNLGGYWALAFFRGLAFLALFALILVWLLKRLGRHYHPYLAATAALLYLMVLLPRYASLRPHVFTYLFIAASLLSLYNSSDPYLSLKFILRPLAFFYLMFVVYFVVNHDLMILLISLNMLMHYHLNLEYFQLN